MRRRDQSGNQIHLVPLDLTKRLYDVLQTSSNKTFNNMLAASLEREYGEYLISGISAWSDPDKILNMAGNLCTKL
jgi:hypothetical protein